MLETFLISVTSLLSGCVLSSIAISGKYERTIFEQHKTIDGHHETLIKINKTFEEDKCQLKLQSQEALEQHLLANHELRMLKAKGEQTINELISQINDVETKLLRSESAFRELSSEYDTLDEVYAKLSLDYDTRGSVLNEKESIIEDLTSEVEDLASKLENTIFELDQVKSNYVDMATQANEEIAKLQNMLKSYHQALDETAKKNQQLLTMANGTVPNKPMGMAS